MNDDTPEMPEGLPPQFWDPQSNQVNMPELVKSYGEATALKQQHDEHLSTLPKLASDYKIELQLPEGVTVPEGLELSYAKDKRADAVRAFAHKHHLSQESLNELVALDAQRQIAEHAADDAAMQAETAKIGENGPERARAMTVALSSLLTEQEYEGLRGFVDSADAFAGLETLIAKATANGVPRNGAGHNPNPQTRRPADIFYGRKGG